MFKGSGPECLEILLSIQTVRGSVNRTWVVISPTLVGGGANLPPLDFLNNSVRKNLIAMKLLNFFSTTYCATSQKVSSIFFGK